MRKPSRPSPALVVSFLALAVSLGGTAWAVTALPRNSVGPKQIKKNAVRSSDIKAGAVRGADVRDGTLGTADFAPGTLLKGDKGETGERGAQGEPGAPGAPAAKAWAMVSASGTILRASSPAVTVTDGDVSEPGEWIVDFGTDVSKCAYIGNIAHTTTRFATAIVSVNGIFSEPEWVYVNIHAVYEDVEGSGAVDQPFTVAALC